MMKTVHVVGTSPDNVFAVLADGWSYAGWVVGNSHIRDVDEGWPSVGTRIHHSAGAWPTQIEDTTTVLAVEPGRLLELEAHLWVLGTAKVRISLSPLHNGTGTQVTMEEEVVGGPASLVPGVLQGVLFGPRNKESLARLGDLAVGRDAPSLGAGENEIR
ncbi:SRPBCC family protein [Lentzea sp. BCCO 10_0061]|uniref:SRPBCC family protein n=1 Tax=Lentzea sokolovensis TaxID=3095429 RepID=A0ABU4V6F1_9PSEU|nr:SRPBCC family protein [Lentzea sp. BCCO 10_0061]MDX8147309.1 SRPBCC family protein [Lentzea sp. BCCO 10_0061]